MCPEAVTVGTAVLLLSCLLLWTTMSFNYLGTAHFGGDIRDIADVLSADIVDIVSRDHPFADLKNDRVVGWGNEYSGGDARLVQNSTRMVLSGFFL